MFFVSQCCLVAAPKTKGISHNRTLGLGSAWETEAPAASPDKTIASQKD